MVIGKDLLDTVDDDGAALLSQHPAPGARRENGRTGGRVWVHGL